MIGFENVTFSYSRRRPPVISDVSLELRKGGVYGLLGKNGVGKSTMLYLMAGLLTPQSGKICFEGENVRSRRPEIMSDIFIMPEEIELPKMRLRDYVKVNAPFYPRFSRDDMQRYISKIEMDEDVNLHDLSMGQKKKVSMSFALACNTPLLLMDEPTNGLDIPSKEIFRSFMAGSVDEERTIVISTHQIHDVERLIDNVIIMDGGQVIFNHSMKEITERLNFMITDRRDIIKEALFTRPAIGGMAVVIPNDFNEETDVDIEMLFNLAVHNPGLLDYIFNK